MLQEEMIMKKKNQKKKEWFDSDVTGKHAYIYIL